MSKWKQRLGVGYVVGLVVVGAVAATAFPADNMDDRFLHALFAVCGVGIVVVITMFALMFVVAARQTRASQEPPAEG
jgi:heme/copper-type cytochrome/quinol oxidase subunit 2